MNAILLQKHSSEDDKIEAIIKMRRGVGGKVTDMSAFIPWSWSPTINNMQVEDPENYRAPMTLLMLYQGQNNSAQMMMWTLCGIVRACNAVHYAIDQKDEPHHYDNWTGHLLAHVDVTYMMHTKTQCPQKSPFPGRRSASLLREKIEKSMPSEMAYFYGTD